MIQITFLGGADEVGASCLLIEMNGRRVLVDAGLRPSPKSRWGLAGDQLPDLSAIDRAGGLDAILVTHAHTDHTGALELVSARFPGCPVYANPVTIELVRVLHQDGRRIMKTRFDEEGELPLYDDLAVDKLMQSFIPVSYHTRLPLGNGLAAMFFPAGHIAGAAMIGLESDEGRLLISGDLSISPQRTVEAARTPAFHPDVLILESTYGGRLHANRSAEERRLVQTIAETIDAGGKVLIPAFALGRAQELLLALSEARRRGTFPPVPVWADGMVRAICQAYTRFPEALPFALQERGAQFFDDHTRLVQTAQQRNDLIWQPDPVVIIASSGMLAGGPSTSYARSLAGEAHNAILLTGYQDEESPGRRLQEIAERGHGVLRLGKNQVEVSCRLGTYSLSAHADEGQLLALVEALDPGEVLLVHGDEKARTSLAHSLNQRKRSVRLPHAGQTLVFQFPRRPAKISHSPVSAGQPINLQVLWQRLNRPGVGQAGGYYTLAELASDWWGDEALKDQDYRQSCMAELNEKLEGDATYFYHVDTAYLSFTSSEGRLYCARTAEQIKAFQDHQTAMQAYLEAAGHWLVVRQLPGGLALAYCLAVAFDHLNITPDPQADPSLLEIQEVFPENILAVLDQSAPDPGILDAYRPQPLKPATMEPNAALALASSLFPPGARLRRSGYRIDQHILVLTFDFPGIAVQAYSNLFEQLEQRSGWKVEVAPETNQAALNALVREVLSGCEIVKGPAIFSNQKRVAVTVCAQTGTMTPSFLDSAVQRFQQESGFELILQTASPNALLAGALENVSIKAGGRAAPMEINAAYSIIQAGLAGTSLYRTSLKGELIVLSFISPQVGERYHEQISALEGQVGWKLAINPQPNQGAILEVARALIAECGFQIIRGPGARLESQEVTVTVAGQPAAADMERLQSRFTEQTGFRLVLTDQGPPVPAGRAPSGPGVVEPTRAIAQAAVEIFEIPLERIRLRPDQQRLELSNEKLARTVERARRIGAITPPIQVRRVANGYILLDGLYRLRAAQALGLERIPAQVEP